MSRQLKIGLVQMAMGPVAEKNREHAAMMVAQAASKGAEVICLPELFTSPYFCASPEPNFEYAEPIPGPTSMLLQDLARKHKVWLFGGSIHEKSGDKFFNTTIVCAPTGDVMGIYRKTHIPHDDSFYEKHFFAPGDTGFKVFSHEGTNIGTLICYDQWYPEAARANALLGADIVFYPTAIGTVDGVVQQEGDWQQAWENVQRGHAIANGMVVAAVNRVGKEGEMKFWGGSFICDAFGKTLARAGDAEEVVVAAVDIDHGKFVKEGWRFFYNRRPETYTILQAPPVGSAKA